MSVYLFKYQIQKGNLQFLQTFRVLTELKLSLCMYEVLIMASAFLMNSADIFWGMSTGLRSMTQVKATWKMWNVGHI